MITIYEAVLSEGEILPREAVAIKKGYVHWPSGSVSKLGGRLNYEFFKTWTEAHKWLILRTDFEYFEAKKAFDRLEKKRVTIKKLVKKGK